MESLIRRYKSNLIASGKAAALFSLWNFAKIFLITAVILYYILNPEIAASVGMEMDPVDLETGDMISIPTIVFVFSILSVALQLVLGLFAKKQANAASPSMLFIFLIIAQLVVSLYATLATPRYDELAAMSAIFLIVNVTSAIAMIVMLYTSIRLKSLSRTYNLKEV
ncbi:MAG: hypothetical protein HUJ73_02875 [Eubacterium sp.]|nr:hypothetical protein [Eubacterium sp.]